MARHIPSEAYDAYFAYFTACTRQDLVSDVSTPTNLNNTLAHVTMTGGDFSVGVGDSSGRKLTIAEKESIDVTDNGTTRHAVLSYTGDGGTTWNIRLVTTCSEREVQETAGDKVNMGSYYLNVAGPVAP